MRLRRDPRATSYLENSDKVIQNPVEYKGKWAQLFGNNNCVHVEFGSGKGGFITQLAHLNPDINYIAVEKAETVVYKACKRADDMPSNLYFLYFDVADCLDIFANGEVERIYLNFSDPWPKARYAKRRLTYRDFLDKYKQVLVEGGEIHFKTDNKGLFASSIEEFSMRKWLIKNVSLDLHNDEQTGNIMTEYENKFSQLGFTINRLEAVAP
ncbi:MAG: tRNA (guanosine(46)-N7)-methyltransferase TrmB [Epulopiscium sp. Nuni2H_MBin001]|nr:MAG: tRNA (guanosine(46)-N7)-methyltransferase TrmB [Epulopiscium sp. Nuni2H_MBin001]